MLMGRAPDAVPGAGDGGTCAVGANARVDDEPYLRLTGITKIFRRDATDLGPAGKYDQFTLVFLDPPYGKGLAAKALVSARDGGWLASDAVIVVEERKGSEVVLPAGMLEFDRRTWGDTQMIFARHSRTQSPRSSENGRGEN